MELLITTRVPREELPANCYCLVVTITHYDYSNTWDLLFKPEEVDKLKKCITEITTGEVGMYGTIRSATVMELIGKMSYGEDSGGLVRDYELYWYDAGGTKYNVDVIR